MDYISALSNAYSANSRKVWDFVNSVKSCCQSSPPLNSSGNCISDDIEKATIFNEYFNSVFKTVPAYNFCMSLYSVMKRLLIPHQRMFLKNLAIYNTINPVVQIIYWFNC